MAFFCVPSDADASSQSCARDSQRDPTGLRHVPISSFHRIMIAYDRMRNDSHTVFLGAFFLKGNIVFHYRMVYTRFILKIE